MRIPNKEIISYLHVHVGSSWEGRGHIVADRLSGHLLIVQVYVAVDAIVGIWEGHCLWELWPDALGRSKQFQNKNPSSAVIINDTALVWTYSRTSRHRTNLYLHVEGFTRRNSVAATKEVVELKLKDVHSTGVEHINKRFFSSNSV